MKNNTNTNYIYLSTYVLQQDMRIRLPKSIINNLDVVQGKSEFAIYFNPNSEELILKKIKNNSINKNNKGRKTEWT